MSISLAIVADFNPKARSHTATNDAIAHSAAELGINVFSQWIGTDELTGSDAFDLIADHDAVWVGPCSPYRSMEGALTAIRYARERGIPMLGTCGGFQHTVIEFARNVLEIAGAEHEETAGQKGAAPPQFFISRLSCSLVGRAMTLTFAPESKLRQIYGQESAEEEYICNFGVNLEVVETLRAGGLRIAAGDAEGMVRAVELPAERHPFFVATLFLPQHRSAEGKPHPVVTAFLRAATARYKS